MKLTFGTYEHSCLGFPGVVLKWTVIDGKMDCAYLVENKVIKYDWTWRNPHPLPFIEDELKRFDDWTRTNYKDNPKVQG